MKFRIDYIRQLNAFRDIKLNTPGLTSGMIAVYHSLLEINNQWNWSEEFDVDFGYILALSKVDKTTYYKALEFFLVNGLIDRYTKGVNHYTKAKVTLTVLGEKSIGNSPTESPSKSLGNSLSEQDAEHNTLKETLNNKPKKETKIDFAIFWNLYPTKISKKKAKEKWDSLKQVDQTKIIEILPAYAVWKQFPGWNHPNPTTFLNQERWDDDISQNTLKSENPQHHVAPLPKSLQKFAVQ
ncbi:hypothetical protein ACFOWA_13190 [Pedobacter lithocola]|uniref:Uncharacterized protein n=1 Tax=Pedobacter lithocola TaxID=1908239 RepID=A0ABV8PB02_9SPHI